MVKATCSSQLLYNALVQAPGGGLASRIFQFQNGSATPLNVGVSAALFPTPSRDGRFITFSGVDPLRPNQASSDLFLFDRGTGRTTTLVDNTALANRDQSITSRQPLFSAMSPNNQLVAVHTIVATISNNGGGTFEHLEMIRADGQGLPQLVEISSGQVANLHRAEFFGISWSPNGVVFATPAAIPIPTLNGQITSLPGIVTYAFNPNVVPFGAWQRSARLSQPTNADGSDNFQIYPAFSPNGQQVAFFNVRASPLLNAPAIATLVVANADGSAASGLTSFPAGLFPGGLTWASDGSLLIYSIGQQASAAVAPGSFNSPHALCRKRRSFALSMSTAAMPSSSPTSMQGSHPQTRSLSSTSRHPPLRISTTVPFA